MLKKRETLKASKGSEGGKKEERKWSCHDDECESSLRVLLFDFLLHVLCIQLFLLLIVESKKGEKKTFLIEDFLFFPIFSNFVCVCRLSLQRVVR